MRSAPPTSAIPLSYYTVFAIYEPALTTLGFVGALLLTHDSQAPWPNGPPLEDLPLATRTTILQLGHCLCPSGTLERLVIVHSPHTSEFAAGTPRKGLANLQPKIVGALLTPLLIGDVAHLYVTLWALGDERWNFRNWSPMLIITISLGITLLVPRIMWQLGIGRYVDSRDRPTPKS
ncbi:hypothetical protein B0H14DRAFT_3079417 [Mycena olivaceomarginata]|nr:hypothetical protein B0H14DRAFT_3079417 [Mycena olivaceomarginata]